MITWESHRNHFVAINKGSGAITAPGNLQMVRDLNKNGWNTYFHINHVDMPIGRIKARSSDITCIRGLLIDIDPIHSAISIIDTENGEPLYRPRTAAEGNPISALYENIISEWFGRPFPHTSIYTGRGFHIYLHTENFKPTYPIEWYEVRQRAALYDLSARTAVSSFGARWKVDVSCSDLGRLARVPGTLNWKNGRGAASYVLRNQNNYSGIPKEEYHDFLGRYDVKPTAPPPLPPGADFPTILNTMNATSRRWIDEGADVGDRHRVAYATAKNLLELGLDLGRTLYCVHLGNRWCTNPLPAAEIDRIVGSAQASKRNNVPVQ